MTKALLRKCCATSTRNLVAVFVIFSRHFQPKTKKCWLTDKDTFKNLYPSKRIHVSLKYAANKVMRRHSTYCMQHEETYIVRFKRECIQRQFSCVFPFVHTLYIRKFSSAKYANEALQYNRLLSQFLILCTKHVMEAIDFFTEKKTYKNLLLRTLRTKQDVHTRYTFNTT